MIKSTQEKGQSLKSKHPRGEKNKGILMILKALNLNKVYFVPRSLHPGGE